MIGAIAGDIIGSRFEGGPGPRAGFELFHPDCRFTDDTVCTVAVAEAVMEGADFARTLRSFVRRYPDRGYGGMFLRWAFTDDAPAYGSWGNGAPMRVAAVGWLAADEDEAHKLAAKQARVSHDHPDAVAGAQAVAGAIRRLSREAAVSDVGDWVTGTFGYDLGSRALIGGGFDVSAAGTVPPVLAAAFEAESWEGAVRTAVRLGGDTDTLACIAGAVAEAIHGVPEDIRTRARGYMTPDLTDVLDRFERQRGA